MPQISQMLPSTYIKKEDVPQPVIVTVRGVEEKNVAPTGQPDEFKWIVYFSEFEKGLVLNSTNINSLSQACHSTDTDDWNGKEVVLYTDPTVAYAGKVIGGLRIRAHETRAPVRAPARPAQATSRRPTPVDGDGPPPGHPALADMDDDIPF